MSNVQPYTLVHLPWETHPDGQDKSSFQLGGSALQALIGCLSLWIVCEQVIYLQEICDLYISYNF